MLRPQALFGLELHPLVHGVIWSLALNILAYIGFSLRRQPTSIERMQADAVRAVRISRRSPSFRLWRSSVTVEELTTTVARYLGEERTRSSFESFAAARRISLDPQHEADFQLMRYAEHLLASAIGAASSRLVLSLLLRKRTVSTKAALKLLDDANAAIHYNREILQTALDHVRQGIAVFDKDLRLVCWNRQFGDILDLPTELTRVGVGLDEILRCNAAAGRARPRPDRGARARPHRTLHGMQRAVLERFADRGLVVEVRSNRMPDGGMVTTVTDITPSVEAAEQLERANDHAGAAGARPHRRTDAAQRRARPRQGRRRRGQHLQDALPRRGQPRHPAAAQRRAALRHLADRAPGQRRRRPADRQRRCLAGSGRGDFRRAARNLAARRRRDAAGAVSFRIDELLRQLEVEFTPLAREKGLELHVRALLAERPLGPPPAAAAAAELSPTPSNTRRRAAC